MVWPQNDGSADKLDNKHFENFLVEYIAAAKEVSSIKAKLEMAKKLHLQMYNFFVISYGVFCHLISF